jgi:hypothetical protein
MLLRNLLARWRYPPPALRSRFMPCLRALLFWFRKQTENQRQYILSLIWIWLVAVARRLAGLADEIRLDLSACVAPIGAAR